MKIKLRLFQVAAFLAACCFIGFMIFLLQGCSTEQLPSPPDDASADCIDAEGTQCATSFSVSLKRLPAREEPKEDVHFGDHSGD